MTTKLFSNVRVRFAPSPTGWMHLGNARIALLNYLFAKKYDGTVVLRIEDTDQTRNIDPRGIQIMSNLSWLGLTIDEGPFYQSERDSIYQEYLNRLIEQKQVYRCFETNEELELKRQKQLARGLPPKYDRAGLKLSPAEVEKNLADGKPFIWRLKLPDGSVNITDIAHGTMTFDLSNFSDVAVTRHDGTCTFLFANCVDDIQMRISHVLRGCDHLSNTATQAAMYKLFGATQPIFYHLPLLCGPDGKKISKRDFGASLDDFKKTGFLPEALCNYLGIIGGSFVHEIMDLDELAQAIHFDTSSPTVHFDLEKLRWINHKWIGKLSPEEIAHRSFPLVKTAHPDITFEEKDLALLIKPIHGDLITLGDVVNMLQFVFTKPTVEKKLLTDNKLEIYQNLFKSIFIAQKNNQNLEDLLAAIKAGCKEQQLPLGGAFALMRIALTGNAHGIAIGDLLAMLGAQESRERLTVLVS